ncbi:MAG TPA: cytochrome C biogenesis protein [Alphaproteobacteria bacterium]|nr:cytochrome C biogenesis protein [Paracoccaceae bacterium]RCL81819.1 MAG: cytochrome c-type biogenesis protein CcmH [SAR116 cluster bacterium]RPH14515.1 MAG: cytochrome c-type biogenesis protein CcmH [Alphaproteobacteria bacterium TMED150]HCJ61398.1 cytochrome C biogenesis protein [Alphaproteobacteria bacterium]HCY48179.1 cytochrome C biogenesis protein [Alphaproteobacteria bacterium]|tara:strand:+ start:4181 stop:4633 length:453 start_codon:yes stop_codon:yes gene_type:complete
MRLAVAALCLLVLVPLTSLAVMPGEALDDPKLEERARGITKNLRCLVCQNQSIDDSNAGLAKDLRVLVRERISQGDSDDQVLDFVVDRYGDFVLLTPPFKVQTILLWSSPLILLLIGALFVWRSMNAQPNLASTLSDDEVARLRRIMESD